MGVSGDVIQLYSDANCMVPVFPKTNIKCVYDDNGVSQEQLNKTQEQWNNDQLKENKRIGTTEYYVATLMLNGWNAVSGVFQQTVPCKNITTDMNDNFDQPKTEYSSNADTYTALQEGLQALCTPGYSVIAGDGEITWRTPEKPSIDIPVYLSRAEVK